MKTEVKDWGALYKEQEILKKEQEIVRIKALAKQITKICDATFPDGHFSENRFDIKMDVKKTDNGWGIIYSDWPDRPWDLGHDQKHEIRKIRVEQDKFLVGPIVYSETGEIEEKQAELKDGDIFNEYVARDVTHELQNAFLKKLALKDGVKIGDRGSEDQEKSRFEYFMKACLDYPDVMECAKFESDVLKKDKMRKQLFPKGTLGVKEKIVLFARENLLEPRGFTIHAGGFAIHDGIYMGLGYVENNHTYIVSFNPQSKSAK